ncbi:hypothetical protein B1no1_14460 [Thermolongibacillus altinsuensis]|nr:hypothetical protein B1no1_14460 [Thermolongibacillus altinsuensis]
MFTEKKEVIEKEWGIELPVIFNMFTEKSTASKRSVGGRGSSVEVSVFYLGGGILLLGIAK